MVQIPETAPGNYDLAVHLTPANAGVPEMLEDVFTKIMPVHIEKLVAEAAALRGRLAGAAAKNTAALATVEYVLRFYERTGRGEGGLAALRAVSLPRGVCASQCHSR